MPRKITPAKFENQFENHCQHILMIKTGLTPTEFEALDDKIEQKNIMASILDELNRHCVNNTTPDKKKEKELEMEQRKQTIMKDLEENVFQN